MHQDNSILVVGCRNLKLCDARTYYSKKSGPEVMPCDDDELAIKIKINYIPSVYSKFKRLLLWWSRSRISIDQQLELGI